MGRASRECASIRCLGFGGATTKRSSSSEAGRAAERKRKREGIKDFDLFLSPDPCPAPSLGFCHLRSICLMAAQEMKTFRMPRAPISLALREN